MNQTVPIINGARERLLSERQTLVGERDRLRRERDEYEADFGMGEGDPGIVEREKALLLIGQLDRRVAEIDVALKRVEDGTYGRCASCGEPINPERLEILPSATLCITCASKPSRRW